MDIYKYVQKHERKIPILCMGYNHLLKKKTYMTKEGNDWQSVIRAAAKITGISPKDVAERIVPEFYPLDLKYFQSVNKVGSDIYIRISKGKGKGFQYIKRFKAHEVYDQSIVDKYHQHGVEYLYVPKEHRLVFANFFSSQIIEKLEAENLKDVERITATSDAFYAFKDQIKSSGLSEKSIQLANSTISSMSSAIEQSPTLAELLKKLQDMNENYLFNHSLLIAYIGHHVLNHLLMGTKEQQNNFVFVAFFHDVTLESDELSTINNETDLNKHKLPLEEKNKVMSHALEACNLLREFPQVPIGAPMAIKQHHGALDGVGFVEFASERLAPLSQVFKVVQDYVDAVLTAKDFQQERLQIIENLKRKYPKHTYHETVEVLEKI